MIPEIEQYHQDLNEHEQKICHLLFNEIIEILGENEVKIWHGQPVWFIEGNPITGYSKEKKGIRLMFWSGASFDEEKLNYLGKKFKDASIFYQDVNQIDVDDLRVWLKKSIEIQWDYKNIVKRKGILERLK